MVISCERGWYKAFFVRVDDLKISAASDGASSIYN